MFHIMVLSIVWNGQHILIEIIYSDRRRSWAIEVKTTGEVLVRVPCAVSEKKVMEIAQSKAEWIAKQQVKFQTREKELRRYADGDMISFFGEQLIIARTAGPSRAEISGGYLNISIPDSFSPDDAEMIARDVVMLLYRRLGTTVLDAYVEKYAGLAGVIKPKLRMRLQKKKWGCCTPKNGIIINARVLLAPRIVAEYLVVHEIVHLRYPHHQKAYWSEVERLMPEYRKVEILLKDDGWKWEF
ncbi:MAG: SprT family zinc-dependent metalloprotease [Methanocorpusculum sp.]|uniref:M48 family metallopeptidase n=1 Tax=Methanocorpusculum sp. TaxID=2058474 RepID=UPI00271FAC70|nr:SprT family zinc-dependent metalloprotease [Methanocorpusculum sp.]MDO9523091.1 SprT family zinc-dependent metalloprotease [Methanocorpusculum sp.]